MYKDERYVLNLRPRTCSGKTGAKRNAAKICVSVQNNLTSDDLMLIVLQAAHLRQLCQDAAQPDATADQCSLLRQSLASAKRDLGPFHQALKGKGWKTHNFIISSDETERATYMPL